MDFLHCGNIVQFQNLPRNLNLSPQHIGNGLRISLPCVYHGLIFKRYYVHLDMLDCHIENTQSVICLLCMTPLKGNAGRIKTPVAILLDRWGCNYHTITDQMGSAMTFSDGIVDNKQHQCTIAIDFEQLRITAGYRLTENRCISTAALTDSTKLKICDKFHGRQSILLFETDKFSGDPFVVMFGLFWGRTNFSFVNHVRIRAQWVPRTENLLQFMEKAIVQHYIIQDVPKHYNSLPALEKVKLAVTADGQLSDTIVSQEAGLSTTLLKAWYNDIDLVPQPGQTDGISFSLRGKFSELGDLNSEYFLRIENTKPPRPGATRIFWTADPYDYISMYHPNLFSHPFNGKLI